MPRITIDRTDPVYAAMQQNAALYTEIAQDMLFFSEPEWWPSYVNFGQRPFTVPKFFDFIESVTPDEISFDRWAWGRGDLTVILMYGELDDPQRRKDDPMFMARLDARIRYLDDNEVEDRLELVTRLAPWDRVKMPDIYFGTNIAVKEGTSPILPIIDPGAWEQLRQSIVEAGAESE